jgi:hypothetical protein
MRKLCCIGGMLGICAGLSTLHADAVYYSSNTTNPAYDDIQHSLRDVYGTLTFNSTTGGNYGETAYSIFTVSGTGNQTVPFVFLYDDGDYQFEFGYFIVNNALRALPYDTAAEKQAWAIQAMTTAQSLLVDRNRGSAPAGANITVTDSNDVYTSTSNDANRDHDTGSGDSYEAQNTKTVTLQGGTVISFFIIPNNTLANWQADAANGTFSSFSLNGSSTTAWPLFGISEGNPGVNADGSGDGRDQVFSFFGPTRTTTGNALSATDNPNFAPDPGALGALITFEDIWRGGGGDQDFNDLHFYIGNTAGGEFIPEPSTWAAGVVLLGMAGWAAWRRRA